MSIPHRSIDIHEPEAGDRVSIDCPECDCNGDPEFSPRSCGCRGTGYLPAVLETCSACRGNGEVDRGPLNAGLSRATSPAYRLETCGPCQGFGLVAVPLASEREGWAGR